MLKDIIKHQNDNLGGIFSLKVIPVEDITSIPETAEGVIHHAIITANNGRWLDFYATEYTLDYKEEQQSSEQGDYFSKVLTGKVPKNRPLLVDQFNQFKNRRFVLLIKYNNGTTILVGNIDEPLTFKSTHTSKAEFTARNETDFTFTGKGIDKSPFYYV